MFEVNFTESWFVWTLVSVAAMPFYWNVMGQWELDSQVMTRLFGSNRWLAQKAFTATIFFGSLFRDYCFREAVLAQRSATPWPQWTEYLAYALFAWGGVLLAGSYYQLGITGTYLGDHFGYLMDAPITAFPFNVLKNPMYDGATLLFLADAIRNQSYAGVVLGYWVFFVYRLAIVFESQRTNWIYANRSHFDKLYTINKKKQ